MNAVLWVAQSLLAAAFLTIGGMKLVRTRAQVAAVFAWAADFSDASVKALGVLEVLVAVGLVLPAAVDIAPVLVPVAAIGGLALATGGSVVHLRRSEVSLAAINLVYIVLLGLVVWGRFGPYHF